MTSVPAGAGADLGSGSDGGTVQGADEGWPVQICLILCSHGQRGVQSSACILAPHTSSFSARWVSGFCPPSSAVAASVAAAFFLWWISRHRSATIPPSRLNVEVPHHWVAAATGFHSAGGGQLPHLSQDPFAFSWIMAVIHTRPQPASSLREPHVGENRPRRQKPLCLHICGFPLALWPGYYTCWVSDHGRCEDHDGSNLVPAPQLLFRDVAVVDFLVGSNCICGYPVKLLLSPLGTSVSQLVPVCPHVPQQLPQKPCP